MPWVDRSRVFSSPWGFIRSSKGCNPLDLGPVFRTEASFPPFPPLPLLPLPPPGEGGGKGGDRGRGEGGGNCWLSPFHPFASPENSTSTNWVHPGAYRLARPPKMVKTFDLPTLGLFCCSMAGTMWKRFPGPISPYMGAVPQLGGPASERFSAICRAVRATFGK